jgi:hypothetical protein
VDLLRLEGPAAVADLTTFLVRARRVDPEGAARLVASGPVLAVYVSPVHGGGGPTVLGLRVLRLSAAAAVDVTVPIGALADRLARGDVADVGLALPTAHAADAGWAGVAPPRSGWQVVGAVDEKSLRAAAHAGIAEVAAGSAAGSGAAAVARLRALVWGRDLPGSAGLASGAAFAAEALGFVVEGEPVALYACGPWRRLTTARGHVLARTSSLL